jgi:glutathionylspermidine synthase
MFVKISTEAGFINPETTGTAVNFYLSGDKKNYNKLEEKIKEQVNEYFDEKGIVAGAVTKVVEDFKEAIKTLKPNAINLDGKTQEELMEHYLEITKMVDEIAPERFETFFSQYNESYEKLKAEQDDILNQIAEQEQLISNYKTQLENSELPKSLKDAAQAGIEAAERAIGFMKEGINEAIAQFGREYNSIVESAKNVSISILENLKTEINEKIDATRSLLENRRIYFEANRAEVENKIAEFRATLNA